MQCLTLTEDGRIAGITPVTSADQCPTSSLLVAEPGDLASPALPSAEELGAAWSASFVLVVGCFVIAKQAGAVLSMLK